MTNEQLWESVLGELELTLSKANFTTWFKNTFIASYDENIVVIAVPNAFTKTWFENKYNAPIQKTLRHLTSNEHLEVTYKITSAHNYRVRELQSNDLAGPSAAAPETSAVPAEEINTGLSEGGLNTRYSFDNFIVG